MCGWILEGRLIMDDRKALEQQAKLDHREWILLQNKATAALEVACAAGDRAAKSHHAWLNARTSNRIKMEWDGMGRVD